MANKTYPNHVLANNFENQYATKLDLMQFCTIDDSLAGVAGDTVKINTYTATDGTETLAMGEGNTKDIEVSYETKDYTIELLQNRFSYFDEEEMRDPKIVEKGQEHGVVDMFNTAQTKAMAEFAKASLEAEVDKFDFDAFVDGAALFDDELGELSIFALVHKDDVKEIRKNLKDSLQYVTDYVRTGYIGTVNGVSIYISNEATEGEIILATKKAVTYYSKKGTEVEQERDANIRKNTVYSRKYGIFAFTDATQAVKLVKGA
jgi:hypothetical protein